MANISVQEQINKLVWCAIDNDGQNRKTIKEIMELTTLSKETVRDTLKRSMLFAMCADSKEHWCIAAQRPQQFFVKGHVATASTPLTEEQALAAFAAVTSVTQRRPSYINSYSKSKTLKWFLTEAEFCDLLPCESKVAGMCLSPGDVHKRTVLIRGWPVTLSTRGLFKKAK